MTDALRNGSPNRFPVRFLADEPTDTDSFGSHDRVAQAIASAIVENPSLKVIGLLGPWGSGKSTVVRLTDVALAKTAQTFRIFTYDAWLHQSDPPRRAFLERFLSFLTAEGLTESADWQDKMDVINKKLEKSTTTNTPHLTAAGRVLLFSLLVVPVGSRFLGTDWFSKMAEQDAGLKRWAFPLGLILTLAPLLTAFVIYWTWRPVRFPVGFRPGLFSGTYWKTRAELPKGSWVPFVSRPEFRLADNWRTHRSPHKGDSVLSIVSSKHVREQSSRVVKTPEPSTIEFQTIFRELLKSSEREGQRLVIVVDNLDRLPEAEAVEMWTTIRSFFLGPASVTSVDDRVTFPAVLLPLDPEGLARLHRKDEKDDARGLLQSFMDKTFDLVFHVNGPVVSDWQAFMSDALRRTVGDDITNRWGLDVVRIYQKRLDGRVTPRALNRQVNAIAALWLQWRVTSIPFPIVAYYAIHRDVLDHDLLKGIASPASSLVDYDANWEKSLAGIHFGLEPENAFQVLLQPEVRKAINGEDKEEFVKQATIRGFGRVVYDMLDDEGFGVGMQRRLAELLIVAPDDPIWQPRIWHRLRRLWLSSDMRVRLDGEAKTAILFELLIQNGMEADRVELLTNFQVKLADWTKPEISVFGQRQQDHIAPLLRVWLAHARNRNGISAIVFSDTSLYLDVAAPLYGEDHLTSLLRPETEPDYVASLLSNQLVAKDQFELLNKTMLTLDLQIDFGGRKLLFAAALAALRNGGSDHANRVAAAHLIGVLRSDERLGEDLRTFVRKGTLRDVTIGSFDRSDEDFTGRLLALGVLECSEIPVAGDNWTEFLDTYPDLPDTVDGFIGEYGEHSLMRLTHYGRTINLRPFATALIARRIAMRDLGIVDLPAFLDEWMQNEAIIPEGLRGSLFALLRARDDFMPTLSVMGSRDAALAIYTILITDGQLDAATRSLATDLLTQTLARLSSADWTASISASGPIWTLANKVRNIGLTIPPLGNALFEALVASIPQITSSGELEAANWMSAVWLLGSDDRRTVLRILLDRILDQDVSTDRLAILREGGEEFIRLAMAERADDAIQRILIPALNETEGLIWITGQAAVLKHLIEVASEVTKADLSKRVSRGMTAGSASSMDMISHLMESWNLR